MSTIKIHQIGIDHTLYWMCRVPWLFLLVICLPPTHTHTCIDNPLTKVATAGVVAAVSHAAAAAAAAVALSLLSQQRQSSAPWAISMWVEMSVYVDYMRVYVRMYVCLS